MQECNPLKVNRNSRARGVGCPLLLHHAGVTDSTPSGCDRRPAVLLSAVVECGLHRSSMRTGGCNAPLCHSPGSCNRRSVRPCRSTMDRYELLSELGDGSFGRVVKARLKSPREDDEGVVAIKQLKQRFQSFDSVVLLKEVQSLQVMSHPNIVPLLEVIREQDGQLFFVFEYMGGGSLYDLLKESIDDKASRGSNRLSASRTRDFVKQLLRGLAYIHEKGYSHRDLKPENLLLDEARETLKIADFGLCKKLGPAKMTFYVSSESRAYSCTHKPS